VVLEIRGKWIISLLIYLSIIRWDGYATAFTWNFFAATVKVSTNSQRAEGTGAATEALVAHCSVVSEKLHAACLTQLAHVVNVLQAGALGPAGLLAGVVHEAEPLALLHKAGVVAPFAVVAVLGVAFVLFGVLVLTGTCPFLAWVFLGTIVGALLVDLLLVAGFGTAALFDMTAVFRAVFLGATLVAARRCGETLQQVIFHHKKKKRNKNVLIWFGI
jgi:hypothetical protein